MAEARWEREARQGDVSTGEGEPPLLLPPPSKGAHEMWRALEADDRARGHADDALLLLLIVQIAQPAAPAAGELAAYKRVQRGAQ